jgi:hypothetical protein
MPEPAKMLATLRRAADLTRSTPNRRGHRIELQNCKEILVVGDLHGHIPNFQTLYKLADLARHPGRHLVVQELVHGKFAYPGGGDKSHQAVDLFAAIKCQFPDRVHYLPGNHEQAQWTGRRILKGDTDQNAEFKLGVYTAYSTAYDEILKAYETLFQLSPLAVVTPNRIFASHTLVPAKNFERFDPADLEKDDYTAEERQPNGVAYDMVWGRDTSVTNCANFLTKVNADWLVTGHIPCDSGFAFPSDRHITLDCSASPGGYVLLPADRVLSPEEFRQAAATV